ncbi:hypothetical protein CL616_00115 [archaeon]|nr:hypothetical protein [archaeon]
MKFTRYYLSTLALITAFATGTLTATIIYGETILTRPRQRMQQIEIQEDKRTIDQVARSLTPQLIQLESIYTQTQQNLTQTTLERNQASQNYQITIDELRQCVDQGLGLKKELQTCEQNLEFTLFQP